MKIQLKSDSVCFEHMAYRAQTQIYLKKNIKMMHLLEIVFNTSDASLISISQTHSFIHDYHTLRKYTKF